MGEHSDLVIPKVCKAGVMYDEGPDFYVKVEEVPVPEPGTAPKITEPGQDANLQYQVLTRCS